MLAGALMHVPRPPVACLVHSIAVTHCLAPPTHTTRGHATPRTRPLLPLVTLHPLALVPVLSLPQPPRTVIRHPAVPSLVLPFLFCSCPRPPAAPPLLLLALLLLRRLELLHTSSQRASAQTLSHSMRC